MYIRDKREERTSIQTHGALDPTIDCQCDVVMLYGLNEEIPERLKSFRDAGYRLQFMTGIAWGGYVDYLYGEWDGRDHWDEAQTDRWGNKIMHGQDTPYMCPTVSFADYLTDKLKRLVVDVDAVEAIYVEEPEFFLRGGYSEAFKREYRLYYGEDWVPPHESVDAFYRCSKLKAYLYARTIERVGSAVKEYALQKYGRVLKFCVPTHSLINYTQWKIISPEGKLADIPCVDGLISQTWTGTSREKTWYDGRYEERTFETAYLEFGAMQELVKGTGREMWFLHDPIEDNPVFDWDDYRKNYFCVVAASYLHPLVNKYEICPWPARVMNRKYPKDSPDATYIPEDYATTVSNVFNLSGTLEPAPLPAGTRVGVLCGDCELYQRAYPDCEYGGREPEEETGTVIREKDELIDEIRRTVVNAETPDRERLLDLMASSGFPGFFSLANPLLIYGVPLRPVLLDNVRRYVGYLDDYDVLLLSYEFMKPDYPDVNAALAEWVRRGGVLIYVGDGFDPYHRVRSWWTGKYDNPAEHLFSLLGVALPADRAITSVGEGFVGVWNTNPVFLSFGRKGSDGLRAFVCEAAAKKNLSLEFKNYLDIRRGNLIICACLEHSVSDAPKVYTGRFADMFTPDFALLHEKRVVPGERSVLFDLDTVADDGFAVIGTSVRILSADCDAAGGTVTARVRGIAGIHAAVRLKVPFAVGAATVDGEPCTAEYDAESRTVLLRFRNTAGEHSLRICR